MTDKNITLTEHFIEIRRRLVYSILFFLLAFAVSYIFVEEIYAFLVKPLAEAYGANHHKRMIFTSLTEAFTTYIHLAFLTALFFSTPVFLSQLYLFIAPALYRNEKKIVLSLLISSPVLFFLGALLLYYFILPLAFKFFISFEMEGIGSQMPIELEARISQYLGLITELIFAFGMAFQLPIILILLVKIGLISVKSLKAHRKYWIVFIFVVAAILTPPDVLSQISLAIPMMLLYEIAIIISMRITKKKKYDKDQKAKN